MQWLSRLSLQTKFIMLLSGIVVLVIAIVGGFFLRATYSNITEQTYTRLQSSAERRVVNTLSLLDRLHSDINYLSHVPQLEDYVEAIKADAGPETLEMRQRELSEDYLAFAQSRGIYYQIRFIDMFGDEVAGVDTSPNKISTIVTHSQLENRADQPYFYETFSLTAGKVYVSALGLESDGARLVTPYQSILQYATPVVFDDERYGVIVLTLYADTLTDSLKTGIFPVFMVDNDGYYLFNTDESKRWGRELSTGVTINKDFPELGLRLQTEQSGVFETENYIFAYAPISVEGETEPRWKMVTYITRADAVQPLAATILPSIMVFLAVLLIAMAIATFVIRRLLAPLGELTQAADKVATGNFDIEINAQSPDEFGKLGNAFTGMATNLRSTITSLETQVARRTERLEALNRELNSEIGERQKMEGTLRDSEERFRRSFEDSPLGMTVVSPEYRFVSVNAALCRMLGYTAEELTALTFPQITHLDDLDADVKLAQRLMRGEIPNYSIEKRYIKKNGDLFWIRLTVALVRDEKNNPLYFLSMIEDIAERKRAETDLQNANEQLTNGMLELERRNNESALLNAMGELLQSCDDVTEAYYVIRNIAQKLFPNEIGILSIAASSKNFIEMVAQWGDSKLTETVFSPNDCWALRRGRVHYSDAEDGAPRCTHLSDIHGAATLCIPLMAHGESIGVLSLCQSEYDTANVLKHRQRLAQTVADSVGLALANLRLRDTLRNQSIRDGLTGLFNRRYMEETLDREIRRAARSKSSVGVLMIDIDHFKRFNDTFGHAAGDAMLVELGKLFGQQLRGSDIACRYGGEEFTVIMPDATLEATKQKAEALREEFKRIHLMHEGQSLGPTSLSIGISASPIHGTTGEALLRAADLALYDAKHSGRDRVAVAP